MKDCHLPDDEQQELDDIEHELLPPTTDFASGKQQGETFARRTLNKTRNINIRLSERDVRRLTARTAAEGLP